MKIRYALIVVVLFLAQLSLRAQELLPPGCSASVSGTLFAPVDTTDSRGVADNYLTWEPGQVIRVKFMPGGGKVLREKVMSLAKEWEKYANIKFQFLPDNAPNSEIRVKLGSDLGHNSAVGTLCKAFSPTVHTLHLDTLYLADIDFFWSVIKAEKIPQPHNEDLFRRLMARFPNRWNEKEMYSVVVHEFGHALGLKHEQSFPGAIKWNRSDSVYQYYWRTQGWNRKKVDFNVFDIATQFYTNGSQYDPNSIMHYPIEAWQTTDGYTVGKNYLLSDGDKKLIAALYPRNPADLKQIVPKVQADNYQGIQVSYDATRRGLVIIPKLDLKTNQRLGEVWFVARLVYANNFYVRTDKAYYNWGGTAATYYKLNLLPNTLHNVNQTATTFEMFFPSEYIPDLGKEPFYVEFSIVLNDAQNNQLDRLVYFKSSTTLQMPSK